MIKLIEDGKRLGILCREDPVGAQIYSEYRLYGMAPQFGNLVWQQGDCLAISMRNGVVRLCGQPEDRKELLQFLEFLHPEVILCQKELCDLEHFTVIQSGEVLCCPGEPGESTLVPAYTADVKSMGQLFHRCGMEFEEETFLLEVSRSLRNGAGAFSCALSEGEMTGAALSWQVTDHDAVIGAVAVEERVRRKGIGRSLVAELVRKLAPRSTYVFQESDKNTAFYESCGFVYHSEWVAAKLKNE